MVHDYLAVGSIFSNLYVGDISHCTCVTRTHCLLQVCKYIILQMSVILLKNEEDWTGGTKNVLIIKQEVSKCLDRKWGLILVQIIRNWTPRVFWWLQQKGCTDQWGANKALHINKGLRFFSHHKRREWEGGFCLPELAAPQQWRLWPIKESLGGRYKTQILCTVSPQQI